MNALDTPLMTSQISSARRVASAVSDHERLAALHRLDLLDTPTEEAFDRLTSLAARILRAPVALVSLVDQDRQFFKSAIGLHEEWAASRQSPLSLSFCQYVVGMNEPFAISDARLDPLLRESDAVTRFGVIAYAGMPLRMQDGHVLGSFCVIDWQPRDWTEDELSILRDLATSVMSEIELRAVDRQREEFLSLLAHELRNPIAAIDSLAAGLGRMRPTPDQHEALLALRRQGHTLRRLAEDLLAVGRLEAGSLELHGVAADLGRIVSDIVARCPEPARVRLDLPATPVIAELDPLRAGQMIDNLVRNALSYSAPGTPVEVAVRRDTGTARVLVRDHGVGLDTEELTALFRKYGRVRNERTASVEGVGLGLYLTRLLAEAHGGTISADSEGPALGSTFAITFPIARP